MPARKLARSTIQDNLARARAAGIDWPLPAEWSDGTRWAPNRRRSLSNWLDRNFSMDARTAASVYMDLAPKRWRESGHHHGKCLILLVCVAVSANGQ